MRQINPSIRFYGDRIIILSALILICLYNKDFFISVIYPTYKNFEGNKIAATGLNKPYFWVFEFPIVRDSSIIYSGFDYWRGYGGEISIHKSDIEARGYFDYYISMRRGFVSKNKEFFLNVIDDTTFIYGYIRNNHRYVMDVFRRSEKKTIHLTQVSNQLEYREISIAMDEMNSFFISKKPISLK